MLVPLPVAGQRFRTYKLSKRFDQDISAVCAAFSVILDGEIVRGARIAFGGVAATPKRASQAEQALVGQPWDEAAAQRAMDALSRDYAPLRSEEHTSELQSLMRISYAVFCLKKKKIIYTTHTHKAIIREI